MLTAVARRCVKTMLENRTSAFAIKDTKEIIDIHDEDAQHRWWKKMNWQWKHPLELKRRYRERRAEREEAITPMEGQPGKLILHKPVAEVPAPTEQEIFAVVQINGRQHKIMANDQLRIEWLKYPVGSQIIFDHVMLVGTPLYTVLGRPYLDTAKVIATVEEQTLTDKTLVFKYKRRKNYKRAKGHRQNLTILRVDKIEHSTEGMDAVLLQKF